MKDEGNYILEQKGGAEGREGVGVVSKGGMGVVTGYYCMREL